MLASTGHITAVGLDGQRLWQTHVPTLSWVEGPGRLLCPDTRLRQYRSVRGSAGSSSTRNVSPSYESPSAAQAQSELIRAFERRTSSPGGHEWRVVAAGPGGMTVQPSISVLRTTDPMTVVVGQSERQALLLAVGEQELAVLDRASGSVQATYVRHDVPSWRAYFQPSSPLHQA